MFKVNNKYLLLTLNIFHTFVLVFLLLTLNRQITGSDLDCLDYLQQLT